MALVESMRAFIALNLDIASVRRAADLVVRLRASSDAPRASWVAPTKMHITLKFFGSIDVGLAAPIADALRPLVDGQLAPRLVLGGLGAFPALSRARVVFVGVEDQAGEVAAVFNEVETRMEALGFAREPRAFVPHLTLARLRAPADVRAWFEVEHASDLGDAMVTELVLYRSDAPRAGAEYTPVFRAGFVLGRSARRPPGEQAPAQ